MTAQIEATTTAAPQQPATHFFVITLEVPGYASVTTSGGYNSAPGSTREAAFARIREYAVEASDDPRMRTADVTFFSLEPNQL
ncbi:hypothetical protein ACFVTY_02050 [Streptomyces sp. NPDC058067]|uniref:hypothetical protein n=1 Tax=Streptomyces sp. NPDC058067 TaxID=3346324 RepID=UPI0036E00599